MRVMLVLRGAPGSGKSSFIENNNLEEFKLSMDDIRVALYGYSVDKNGKLSIPQEFNKRVFDIFIKALEERMDREEFVVIDNTNTKASNLKTFKNLCKKKKYRLFVKDFTDYNNKEEYLELLRERNVKRGLIKQIPFEVIKDMVDNLYNSKDEISSYNLIDDISEIFYRQYNLDEFGRVFVFGDIHGNFKALEYALEKMSEKDALILTGDYVDRGIENDKVIDKLYELSQKDNVFIIRGNHEIWLNMHAKGEEENIRSSVYKKYTLPQIESLDNWEKKIKTISNKLLQCFYFSFAGKNYFVSHAAVQYWNSRVINYNLLELCKGREDTDKFEELWNKCENAPYLIHGHISSKDNKVVNGKVFNLNSKLEFNGEMPILILNKDGSYNIEKVSDKDFKYSEEEQTLKMVSIMRASRNIEVKDLGEDIQSLNFSRETFWSRDWDHLNIKARGLFVNKKGNKVLARGYDKFFNYGELSDELEDLELDSSREERFLAEEKEWIKQNEDSIVYPCNFYKKENGFLGLISLVDDKLLFCSKSNAIFEDDVFDKEDNSMFFPRMLRDLCIDKEKYRDVLKNLNKDGKTYSLVFEVLNPIYDPHIIKYDKAHIVLLDIIENNICKTSKLKYEVIEKIAKKLEIPCKEKMFEINNFEELLETVKKIKLEYNRDSEEDIEGAVCEDKNGFMFKVKTNYYIERKNLRKIKEKRYKTFVSQKNKGNIIPIVEYNNSGIFSDFIKSLSEEELNRSFIDVYEDFLETTKK